MGEWSVKAILLTGSNGFLGSQLLEQLAHSYKVIITLRKTSDLTRIKNLIETSSNIQVIYVDECSTKDLENIFSSDQIETIIHCATNYGRGKSYFFEVFNDNVVFPMKLLEIGKAYDLKYFINTDSYFNKENLSYNALPHYSKTKKLFLNYLKELADDITVINMRLEHIYGENDNSDKFISFLCKNLASHESVSLTYGHQKRDFVYISDAVDAYIKIISILHHINGSYIELEVGSGKSISIRKFVETLQENLKSSSIIHFGAIDYRDDEIMNSYANYSLSAFSKKYDVAFYFRDIDAGIKAMLNAK